MEKFLINSYINAYRNKLKDRNISFNSDDWDRIKVSMILSVSKLIKENPQLGKDDLNNILLKRIEKC